MNGSGIDDRNASPERATSGLLAPAMEKFWEGRATALVNWMGRWHDIVAEKSGSRFPRWFVGATLNVSANCLDRHLQAGRKNRAALIWQGDGNDEVRVYTYQLLHGEVCRFAQVLKKYGVGKGDRVVLYMPMIPELPIAMLACARIGAVHAVIFAGYSAANLRERIDDCGARVIVTADAMMRGGRRQGLKENVDEALDGLGQVECCIVVRRTSGEVAMQDGRDYWYHKEICSIDVACDCEPEEMAAEDPLFLIYTPGTSGRPKGVVHSCGGYLVYALHSFSQVFDPGEDDTFWCTGDIGWITGHTCAVYGPLGLGRTALLFEGIPTWPGPDRFWQVVEKHRVTHLYTAPAILRALMRYGNEPADIHDLSSLKVLGSVGQPLTPEVWLWYSRVIGQGYAPVIDTWWQAETGGIMIASPRVLTSESLQGGPPVEGIEAMVLDEEGAEISDGGSGNLAIGSPWPGTPLGVYEIALGERVHDEPWRSGRYLTGDSARRAADGYFVITGRYDDVIRVGNRRIGTAEIEAVLLTRPEVAEAAVVAMSTGELREEIHAYVTVKDGVAVEMGLVESLKQHVGARCGATAVPESVQFVRSLPKTRSGKIMRGVLRRIAAGDYDNLGDTSMLADPAVLTELAPPGRK